MQRYCEPINNYNSIGKYNTIPTSHKLTHLWCLLLLIWPFMLAFIHIIASNCYHRRMKFDLQGSSQFYFEKYSKTRQSVQIWLNEAFIWEFVKNVCQKISNYLLKKTHFWLYDKQNKIVTCRRAWESGMRCGVAWDEGSIRYESIPPGDSRCSSLSIEISNQKTELCHTQVKIITILLPLVCWSTASTWKGGLLAKLLLFKWEIIRWFAQVQPRSSSNRYYARL